MNLIVMLHITVCSEPNHLFINFYTVVVLAIYRPSLSLSSCTYSSRHSHPDHQYLTVPPFHSSIYKPVKHFGHSFVDDAPKIWIGLPNDVCSATSIAYFRKRLKNILSANAYLSSPRNHLCVFLV